MLKKIHHVEGRLPDVILGEEFETDGTLFLFLEDLCHVGPLSPAM